MQAWLNRSPWRRAAVARGPGEAAGRLGLEPPGLLGPPLLEHDACGW